MYLLQFYLRQLPFEVSSSYVSAHVYVVGILCLWVQFTLRCRFWKIVLTI